MPDDAHDSPTPTDASADDTADDTAHRLAELQRRAYGAGGTEAERAAAADELARLGRPAGSAPSGRGAGAAGVALGGREARGERGAPGSAADPDASADRALIEASALVESRVHRRLVGVGALAAAVGVLVGLLGGWWLAMGVVDARPRPGTVAALTDEEQLAALQWRPVEQTGAFRALQREASAEDLPAPWGAQGWLSGMLDDDTVRRLAAASDVQAFGARSADHDELCLLVVLHGEPSSLTCTEHGVFPTQGLQLTTGYGDASGASVHVEITWLPDGTLRLMTPLR